MAATAFQKRWADFVQKNPPMANNTTKVTFTVEQLKKIAHTFHTKGVADGSPENPTNKGDIFSDFSDIFGGRRRR